MILCPDPKPMIYLYIILIMLTFTTAADYWIWRPHNHKISRDLKNTIIYIFYMFVQSIKYFITSTTFEPVQKEKISIVVVYERSKTNLELTYY